MEELLKLYPKLCQRVVELKGVWVRLKDGFKGCWGSRGSRVGMMGRPFLLSLDFDESSSIKMVQNIIMCQNVKIWTLQGPKYAEEIPHRLFEHTNIAHFTETCLVSAP